MGREKEHRMGLELDREFLQEKWGVSKEQVMEASSVNRKESSHHLQYQCMIWRL